LIKRSLTVATMVATATLGGAMLMTATTANAVGGHAVQSTTDQVCTGLDSGKIDTPSGPSQVTVTAPDGMLIDGYCVKAGSINNGNGPVYVDVAPPQKTVTFSYPGGKDISHYSVSYTEAPPNSETTECDTVTITIRETEQVPVTETVTEKETVRTTKTVTATDTVTETAPGETVTETETAPGETVTETVTETAPGETVTETAPGETVTETAPAQTVTNTITLPASTETVTLPGTTATVTQPGETVTVTNTISVAPSEASAPPTATVTEPGSDVTVKGEQAQEVPTQVAAGAEGGNAPASPIPGGNKTLGLLALLVATLGAGLVGASVASKRQS
jgi:hypothetical protein